MPQNHRPQGPPPRHPENMTTFNFTGNSGLGSAHSAGPPTSTSIALGALVLA